MSQDDKIQEMLDHFAIRKVIEKYVHANDRIDPPRIAEVYHPDSLDDHGPIKCSGPQFAREMAAALPAWDSVHHHLGQTSVTVQGDKAGSETYFLASLVRKTDEGDKLDQMGGRYLDTFERRDGEWRIKHRTCVCEWSITTPIKEVFLPAAEFERGKRSRQDLSYALLNIPESARG